MPGLTEGDLTRRTGRSTIGTIVECRRRSALLMHLPHLEGWGEKPCATSGVGSSLGGYEAVAMNSALVTSMTSLPAKLRKSLTWTASRSPQVMRNSRCRPGNGRPSPIPLTAAAPDRRNNGTAPCTSRRVPLVVGRGPRGRHDTLKQQALQDPRLKGPAEVPDETNTVAPTTRSRAYRLNSSSGQVSSGRDDHPPPTEPGRPLNTRSRRVIPRPPANYDPQSTTPRRLAVTVVGSIVRYRLRRPSGQLSTTWPVDGWACTIFAW